MAAADDAALNAGWTADGARVAGYDAGSSIVSVPRASNGDTLRKLLGIAIGAVAIAALYFGKEVLLPITLAIMLSFILSPVVNLLQSARLWRAPAVILTVVAALGTIVAVGMLIGKQTASLSVNATQYAAAIETKVQALEGFATNRMASIANVFGGARKPPRGLVAPPSTQLFSTSAKGAFGPRKSILVEVLPPPSTPFSIAKTILAPVVGPLETMFIVLMVTIFVLMQKEDLRDRFIRIFGSSDLHRTTMALDDAGQRLSRYFLAQLSVNTTFGLIIGVGLWLLGVPSPAMWGVLAGLLRFVPYVGSVLAAGAPMALGAAIDPGWATVIYVALLFITVETMIGYVVEPLLYGHSTGLSPVSVIVSAIFWTWIWGPVGLILSTPMTLCLVVLGRHVKALEFFDVMLGDRPALTPVESFYQRILADNPDEALAQAEITLTDCTLSEYYDGVVLEGLKLAAGDEAKGTIDRERATRMTQTMLAVIEDLNGHVDAGADAAELTAGEEPGPPRIACVAGRGPFDDAVAAMLAQMLTREGIGSRIVAHNAAARGAIADLDLSGIDTIALSYLELNDAPAHLRFLIRRLRQKAPGATIIVGLWPDGEAALSDTAVQQALDANRYVGSLRDAVQAVRDTSESRTGAQDMLQTVKAAG